MSKLLPSNHSEFQDKAYWDRFFIERGSSAFEWYGTYRELQPLITQYIPDKSSRILSIGCGNSEFSHEMYDDGYQSMVNLDYSEVVINEMIKKNQNLSNNIANIRPHMSWQVGDMTNMKEHYADASFDIVLDKGALDALMSVDDPETHKKAKLMFQEIKRVLKTSRSKYICITLAEKYILKTLLSYFAKQGELEWLIQIETFPTSKKSPFVPMCICITKLGMANTIASNNTILCRLDDQGLFLQRPDRLNASDALKRIVGIQEFTQRMFDLQTIQVGRTDTFDLWDTAVNQKIPRFTVMVVDASDTSTRSSVAVFFVPFGRETDYEFSTQTGLTNLAELANTRRLIAIRCNKPHSFPTSMKPLQDELNVHMVPLFPSCKKEEEQVPYLAVAADDSWEIVANGDTKSSGVYVIEDGNIEAEEEGEDIAQNYIKRRLIFLQNQHFVQTEIRLKKVPSLVSDNAKEVEEAEGMSRSKVKQYIIDRKLNMELMEGYLNDCSYLDDHHISALTSLLFSPSLLHPSSASAKRNAVVIGLGGGAFPMILQEYVPHMSIYTCDIDKDVEDIAIQYFGYKPHNQNIFNEADGVEYIASIARNIKDPSIAKPATYTALPPSTVDYLFLDVDSKDGSLGMSAPPDSFTTIECLQDIWECLSEEGLLVVNVVARATHLLEEFKIKMVEVFQEYGPGCTAVIDNGITPGMGGDDSSSNGDKDDKDDMREMIRQAMMSDGNMDSIFDSLGNKAGSTTETSERRQEVDKLVESAVRAGRRRNGHVITVQAGEEVVNVILIAMKNKDFANMDNMNHQSLKEWLDVVDQGSDPFKMNEFVGKLSTRST